MALQLCPLTLREAHAFVARVHRHHRPSRGGKFAIGAARDGQVVGVVVIGRPVSRELQRGGYTAEVLRLAVIEGVRNACSLLYGAAWRAARAMGYRRLVTYTLPSEGGASLIASGWRLIGEAGGGSWSCPSRPRVDEHPTQVKFRWEAVA
jgi:hypothetical protein